MTVRVSRTKTWYDIVLQIRYDHTRAGKGGATIATLRPQVNETPEKKAVLRLLQILPIIQGLSGSETTSLDETTYDATRSAAAMFRSLLSIVSDANALYNIIPKWVGVLCCPLTCSTLEAAKT